jgi:hypothetical protein
MIGFFHWRKGRKKKLFFKTDSFSSGFVRHFVTMYLPSYAVLVNYIIKTNFAPKAAKNTTKTELRRLAASPMHLCREILWKKTRAASDYGTI